jgi:hypothetical protein
MQLAAAVAVERNDRLEHASPPIRGFSPRKSPLECDCVVADAVQVEPVSFQKFSANREINWESCEFPHSPAILGSQLASKIQWFPATFPMQRNREYLAPYREIYLRLASKTGNCS